MEGQDAGTDKSESSTSLASDGVEPIIKLSNCKLLSQGAEAEVRSIMRARKIGILTPVPYLVEQEANSIYMEKVIGKSMKHLLLDGQLTAQDIDTAMASIGQILATLHDGGLIHGDLTTSNMMIRDADKALVLIDFGLSYNSTLPEDKGVDLYVLERALASTHGTMEGLFDKILASYKKHSRQWSATFNRFADVLYRFALDGCPQGMLQQVL